MARELSAGRAPGTASRQLARIEGMDVIAVRHAIAEDREVFAETGEPDGMRPLTQAGIKKMKRNARGLLTLVPSVDLLATSPLVRALQTAEILASLYGRLEPVVVDALRPDGTCESLLSWLQSLDREATIMTVGHEPSLGIHVSRLSAGSTESFLWFKKGGACLLRFDGEVGVGCADLRWLLTPGQLRRLDATR